MSPKGNAPIIKKVIKKGGHGHHGGAWKVAYADFVTAMMAFFLLLWLLTATPVENLKGLADYFSPTMGLKDKMGIGFRGGQGTQPEGASPGDSANAGIVFGAPPSGPILKLTDKDNLSEENSDNNLFSRMERDISKAIEQSQELKNMSDNILIQQTPEGLVIQLMDQKDEPMFKPNGAELMPYAQAILERVVSIIRFLPNYIQVTGYTSSVAPQTGDKNYSNWELSMDRANAARRYITQVGIDPEQVARIVGKADQEPMDRDHPEAENNSRITLTLLRNQHVPSHKRSSPEDLLLSPNGAEHLWGSKERTRKPEEQPAEKAPAPKAPEAPASKEPTKESEKEKAPAPVAPAPEKSEKKSAH